MPKNAIRKLRIDTVRRASLTRLTRVHLPFSLLRCPGKQLPDALFLEKPNGTRMILHVGVFFTQFCGVKLSPECASSTELVLTFVQQLSDLVNAHVRHILVGEYGVIVFNNVGQFVYSYKPERVPGDGQP